MSDARMDEFLVRWFAMIESGNGRALPDMLAEDVEFRSPFAFTPYRGRRAVAGLLQTVMQVLRDFRYHRQFVAGDSVALEFGAYIGDLSLKGIDLIRLDDDGRIVDFEVMIRPANALLALGEEMGKRLAAQNIKP
ncbi:MAG: nuclear transport factor 2 family protein [Caldilinea sp.]|nr:nuclear transport factor 2 family protein [Caldilinea sp.]